LKSGDTIFRENGEVKTPQYGGFCSGITNYPEKMQDFPNLVCFANKFAIYYIYMIIESSIGLARNTKHGKREKRSQEHFLGWL